MTECDHDWEDVTGVKDPHEQTVVMQCRRCSHLWLPDFDNEPPSVPQLG